tara:strand:- start:395 stop:577 length:183 start_codon:yes stop_codon:yes gene_type:complete
MKRYSIELRVYSEDGDDYSEDYYDFDTREECRAFWKANRSQVHNVLDYQDRDHDPIHIHF